LCGCSQGKDTFRTYEEGNVSANYPPAEVAAGLSDIRYNVFGEVDPSSLSKLVEPEFREQLTCGQRPTIHLEAGIDGEFRPIQIMSGPILIPIDAGDVTGNYDALLGTLMEMTDGVSMLIYSNDRLIAEAPFVRKTELVGDLGAQSGVASFGDQRKQLVEGNIPWCLSGRINSDATNVIAQFVEYGQIKVRFKSHFDNGENTLFEMNVDMTAFPRVAEVVAQDVRASQ
jgi:hypothetical protein